MGGKKKWKKNKQNIFAEPKFHNQIS